MKLITVLFSPFSCYFLSARSKWSSRPLFPTPDVSYNHKCKCAISYPNYEISSEVSPRYYVIKMSLTLPCIYLKILLLIYKLQERRQAWGAAEAEVEWCDVYEIKTECSRNSSRGQREIFSALTARRVSTSFETYRTLRAENFQTDSKVTIRSTNWNVSGEYRAAGTWGWHSHRHLCADCVAKVGSLISPSL
jgi:hypothetical protein